MYCINNYLSAVGNHFTKAHPSYENTWNGYVVTHVMKFMLKAGHAVLGVVQCIPIIGLIIYFVESFFAVQHVPVPIVLNNEAINRAQKHLEVLLELIKQKPKNESDPNTISDWANDFWMMLGYILSSLRDVNSKRFVYEKPDFDGQSYSTLNFSAQTYYSVLEHILEKADSKVRKEAEERMMLILEPSKNCLFCNEIKYIYSYSEEMKQYLVDEAATIP